MRYKYLILIIILATSACEMLDVEPTDKITADIALSSPKGIESALIGAYDQLQSASVSQDAIMFGDLAADNLIHIGTKKEYRQISDNRVSPENAYISGLWNSCYDGINRVNNILAQIDGVEGFAAGEKERIKGEALFLRAYNYFVLTKYFGGVPYKTKPTTGISDEELLVTRSTKTDMFTYILNDLTEAATLLAGTGKGTPAFATEGAVKAFQARVYLYNNDWTNAATKASEVINMGYELTAGDKYADIFDEEITTDEIIFEIDFANDDDVNGMADWYLPEGRFEVVAWNDEEKTGSIADEFNDADKRKDATVGLYQAPGGDVHYGNKYSDVQNDNDNIIVLRLADMYLIRAEALNEIAYVADDAAFEMLNAIRLRAGVSTYNSSNLDTQQKFREAIEKERRLEFAFEGHRFFDLRRTGRMTIVLPAVGTLTRECNGYFPIPQSELDLNTKMTPNEGY